MSKKSIKNYKLKIKSYGLFLMFIFHFEFFILNCLYSVDNIDREKLTLETNIEKRIADSLSKLLSPQDFIIIIKIEPLIEEIAKAKPREKLQIEQLTTPDVKKTQKDYILPGVPTKKNLMEEEKVSPSPVQVIVPPQEKEIETLKQFIKKITVTVKFDKNVPDNVIAEARKIITGLVDINTVRGDQLIIEKTEFYKKKIPWWSVATTFPSAMWLLGIILFAFFLFGPLNVFFKHLLKTLSTKPAAERPIDNFLSRNPAAPTGGSGVGSLTMALDDGKSARPKLFAFINEGNLRNLAYLLKDESPDRTALVLSYLKNDWASYVMSQLPADLQSKVAVELANVKQLEPDDVEIMELELKKKIDYLIGGAAQIIELCERSDKKTVENILAALSLNNSELAEQVRQQLLSIDDLYFVDTVGLRTLFREISLPTWAIGLKNAKDSTRETVLKTLPPGAAEMLKQEIELNMTVQPARIDEEEKRIIITMRKLRNEGQITLIKGERPTEIIPAPSETNHATATQEKQETKTETREERLARIKERLKKERGG
ncbi:MAG: hypothetical protein COS68_01085 [Elusimicrobia bacterium CG06_land_8_20_14_3_00_38_11]|nr:MAG: hypothetical protein COS68_01085 [Elusimicrobia bacterium CG06_land_8_20_14_3_00_38_11]